MRWGLVPAASAPGPVGRPLINARAETADRAAPFRRAFRQRRCLVPADGYADGYYEWSVTETGRQPHLFRRGDGAVFCFAGLWETWQGAGGDAPIHSFAILTTGASELVRPIHDRMPVILAPAAYGQWLGEEETTDGGLARLMASGGDDDFITYPVSARVNSHVNDDAACVEPVNAADPGADEEGHIGRLL